jgi:TolB-like protein/AraC-like DNA-binding protein/Tfp pilus assembly protein PilF
MSETPSIQNDFIIQLTSVIEQNMSNEQFGVSELANQMNMSRSNLLRKVKRETNLSVSQLISQVRLKKAMDLLLSSSLNVSEVSHEVGFNSPSYFIKCFREYYGFPPGEAGGKHVSGTPQITHEFEHAHNASKMRTVVLITVVAIVALAATLLLIYRSGKLWTGTREEKSIVVLPFKNESSDSSNVYLINGLMESTLSNLQKIRELKVLSRTSAEKYRNSTKSIPEMASELHATYFIEGSGQKIGDEILLNIQLIEGSTDTHLWSKQYKRKAKDIFTLQQEIAKNVAEEIEVIITPDEQKILAKNPTENLEAYDQFLKGREELYGGGTQNLERAITYLKKAIELDPKFAMAYGEAVISYYYLDLFQTHKTYSTEMGVYAEKAMLLDPKIAESLIAKGLYYIHEKQNDEAVPYLEKALEVNPGSGLVLHFLTEYYNINNPNTGKYLKYAIMGVELERGSEDSVNLSYKYLQLCNALLQTGFLDESKKYINQCLAYNPKNPFGYIWIFVDYAKTKDLRTTKQLLLEELKKDTTRLDVMLQVGTLCYVMRDYDEAYQYLKRFADMREARHLEIFKNEDLMIAKVFAMHDDKEKSAQFVQSFKAFADSDQSIYKNMHLCIYYCYQGDIPKAMEHFRLFSKEDNVQYWILLLEREPNIEPIVNNPEFRKIFAEIQRKFWANHDKIKAELENSGLL